MAADWTGARAPRGASLTIRDVERGQAAVEITSGTSVYAIGVQPHDRLPAARALAGEDYVVIPVGELAEVRELLHRLQVGLT